MRNHISIKEIAALADVSVATVSRVMNHKGGYSAETEEKVRKIIKEHRYTPNMVAKGLRTNKNPIIGILVPDIVNEHFSKLVLELQNVLFANGYLTMVCNSNESGELEKQHLKAMIGQNVSGIVLISGAGGNLRSEGIPTVYVDRRPQADAGTDIIFVESDNIEGGYRATKELIEKGCRKIAFVTDLLRESSKVARYQGYCNALLEAGIELNPSMVLKVERVTVEAAYEVITENLDHGMNIDGVMCTTDMLAIGTVLALEERGIRVPKEVKVTGYDDISASRLFRVPITTVHQYTDEMAKLVSELMLQLIDGENVAEKKYSVPVSLIKRKSTE